MIKLNISRFASGEILLSSVSTSSSVTFQGKLVWSSTANTTANTSNVTVKLYARKQGSSTATSGSGWNGYITIDGTKTTFNTGSLSVKNDWVLISTATKNNIQHGNDGTKSITLAGSVSGPSGTTLGSKTSSGSGTATLDRIYRQSSLSNVAINITTTSGTTTVTVVPQGTKYIGTYYDTLYITYGSYSLNFAGITFGDTQTLTDAQKTTLWNMFGDSRSVAVSCYVTSKTSSSGTVVGNSNVVSVVANLPEHTWSMGSPTIYDTIDTYDQYKVNYYDIIASLSSPSITFSPTSSTGDWYGNPAKMWVTFGEGDGVVRYDNITTSLIIPVSDTYGLKSPIKCSGTYRGENAGVILEPPVNVIPYITPYCSLPGCRRATPTSQNIIVEFYATYYDGDGLNSSALANDITLNVTYQVAGDAQPTTIPQSSFTRTSHSVTDHVVKDRYSATVATGSATDYQKNTYITISFTDLISNSSSTLSLTIKPGLPLWYGYSDSSYVQHYVVTGTMRVNKDATFDRNVNIKPGDEDGDLSTGTYYHRFPLFLEYDGTNTKPILHADDIEFERYPGNSSNNGGYEMIRLGNETVDGTEGSRCGRLRLFGTNQYRTDLRVGATTANRIIYIPNHDGTLVNATRIYNNTSGVSTNFTLDESSANYDVLEFLCCYSDNSSYFTTRVIAPNGKKVQICSSYCNPSSTYYLYQNVAVYTINGTSVTKNEEIRWRFATSGNPTRTADATNIKIYQVWGYRFS